MLDRGYLREAGASARQSAARWTFEHHYRALLAVFSEARKGRCAA
jgi:UDP-glucose:(heptosyl)LPS alpha-1,3-glucosyltransferase